MQLKIEYYFPSKEPDNLLKRIDIEIDTFTLVRDFLALLRTRHLQAGVLVPARLVLVLRGTSLQEDQFLDSYELKDGAKLYLVEGRVQVNVLMLANPLRGPQGGEKTVSLIFPTERTAVQTVRAALQRVTRSRLEHRLTYEDYGDRILSDYEILSCINHHVPTLRLHLGNELYFNMGYSTPIPFFVPSYQTTEQVQEMLQGKQKLMYGGNVCTGQHGLSHIPSQSTVELRTSSTRMQITVQLNPNDQILLDVDPSYTIKQVKHLTHLQSDQTSNIYLEFQGRELTCEENTLKFYNVQSGAVLLCKRYMQIFLRGLGGSSRTFNVTPKQQVWKLKREMSYGAHGFCFSLYYLLGERGKTLEDERSLADYNVSKMSTITVICRSTHCSLSLCENCRLGIAPCIGKNAILCFK